MNLPVSQFTPCEQAVDLTCSPRTWMPSPAKVVAQCAAMCAVEPPSSIRSLFDSMGIPSLDLLVTPLSARVGLLAAAQGQVFFHHELRGRLPIPEHIAPERQVWEKGAVPVWENGVLVEPKYFSFFLDGQVAPYNPNYRRKWRAHELLHGAVGFFWHPEMTRFSCYLGARLDELLPVIHWHHLDEVFRPRCAAHRGRAMLREWCPRCEAAGVPFWTHAEEWLQAESALADDWVESGLSHFATEWAACWQECQTGKRVEVPRGQLNASSDAMGYLYSHWPRLTAWSFGAWVEMFLVEGLDYHSSIPGMMNRVGEVAQALVSGELSAPLDGAPALRARRALLDLGYRALQLLEWFDEGSRQAQEAEDRLMPCLEQAAAISHALLMTHMSHKPLKEVAACVQELNEMAMTVVSGVPGLPDELARAFPMHGFVWEGVESIVGMELPSIRTQSLPQIVRGLRTAAPQSFERAEVALEALSLDAFVCDPLFGAPGRLLNRLSLWLNSQSQLPETLQLWCAFEAWLYDEPGLDEEAACFGSIPEEVGMLLDAPGELRLHRTFRMKEWPAILLEDALGGEIHGEYGTIAAIQHDGAPQLMFVEASMAPILTYLAEGAPFATWYIPAFDEHLLALLEHGFLVWLPAPIYLPSPSMDAAEI